MSESASGNQNKLCPGADILAYGYKNTIFWVEKCPLHTVNVYSTMPVDWHQAILPCGDIVGVNNGN